MTKITFGNVNIPALGYGTWKLTGEECVRGVTSALELGYRHIDTAQIYDNEEEVGKGLAQSDVARGDIFLTTKVWMDRVGKGALEKSVDESLKKLKSDYVDLLLIHWPVDDVPLDEQIAALRAVQDSGKTKLIGVSNFTVAQMKQVRETLGANIATNQVEYHPYLSQKPVLDYLRAHSMFLTAYSPIARGAVLNDPVVNEIAQAHNKSPAQITLRWLVQQGDVAAIPKASTVEKMRANLAIYDFSLSEAEMARIHALANPQGRLINPDWAPQWDQAA